MKQFFFITSNQGKLKEAQEILKNFKLIGKKIDLPEMQTLDLDLLIKEKARVAFKIIKKPLIVEDTSLIFRAWKKMPGPTMKWFLQTVGNHGLIKMLKAYKNRKALAICSIGCIDNKTIKIFHGEVSGIITKKPRGKNGIGWDPIFQPKGFNKTFAQMKAQEKNKVSMRRVALEKLKRYLNS